jgi:two-component sensor histidine kinase
MDALFRLLPGPLPVFVRYGWTALFILVAFAIRYAVGDNAGPYPFLIFILPIVGSALLFDRGTGFFATALSAALLSTLLDWNERTHVHVAALSLFTFVSCCLVFLAESLHRALEVAHRAQETSHLLLQEMSHRVKNKFAVISSIIALQGRQSSPEVREALENVGSRVDVIAAVHSSLQLSRHDGHIEMSGYLTGLCRSLESALDSNARSISLLCTSVQLLLPPDKALAVGLVVNELVTNAFKYAFGDRGGRVLVELSLEQDAVVLAVSDDGKGCPSQPREGLGTRLVKTFAEQLGGSARWSPGELGGCRVTVQFPE